MTTPDRSLFTTVFALMLGIVALTAWRYAPPAPVGADAPVDRFSAVRAAAVLERVLGDGAPHPLGSESNAAVRSRIVAELVGLGYETSIQETFVTGMYGSAGRVHNVVAWRPGRRAGEVVLVAAHHDSAEVAPGASDDGIGVGSLLEIARALGETSLERGVLFLFTDGEEAGLLGAQAFVDQHPRAGEVKAVVNLDGRGSGGIGMLFQTGAGPGGDLVSRFARVAERPVASSAFETVYRYLPGETDFTVFAGAGHQGYGLAFVGDVFHYHTPADSPAHLDPGSLQHLGENALRLVASLAQVPDLEASDGERTYFDLVGLVLIHWPRWLDLPVAVLALVLMLGAPAPARAREGSVRTLFGTLAWIGVLAAGALGGHATHRVIGITGALPAHWVADPIPALAACSLGGLGMAMAAARFLGRRTGLDALHHGTLLGFVVVALVEAVAFPGAGYGFLVPGAIGAAASCWASTSPDSRTRDVLARALTALAAGLLWIPVGWLAYRSLGFTAGLVPGLLAALVMSPVLPAAGGKPPATTGGAIAPVRSILLAAGFLAGLAMTRIPFTPARPQPLLLLHYQEEGADRGLWLVSALFGPLPGQARNLAGFEPEPRRVFPWSGPLGTCHVAPAPALPAAAPAIDVLDEEDTPDGRRIRFRFRSRRSSASGGFLVAPEVPLVEVRVDGKPFRPIPPKMTRLMNGWRRYVIATLPPEGVLFELTFLGRDPVELVVYDTVPALPPGGHALRRSFPATTTHLHLEDSSVVARRVRLFSGNEEPGAGPGARSEPHRSSR